MARHDLVFVTKENEHILRERAREQGKELPSDPTPTPEDGNDPDAA